MVSHIMLLMIIIILWIIIHYWSEHVVAATVSAAANCSSLSDIAALIIAGVFAWHKDDHRLVSPSADIYRERLKKKRQGCRNEKGKKCEIVECNERRTKQRYLYSRRRIITAGRVAICLFACWNTKCYAAHYYCSRMYTWCVSILPFARAVHVEVHQHGGQFTVHTKQQCLTIRYR